MVRSALTSLAVSACVLMVAACDGNDPGTPTPAPTSSTPPSSASASPTTSAVPPYLVRYSAAERAAYAAAVRDYQRFSRRNADFYRVGKATPAAKAYYKEASAAWQSYWARLMRFDSGAIRVIGRAEVVRIRPAVVRIGPKGGGEVGLRVCSVARGVKVVEKGKPVPQPSPTPTVTRVSMVKLPGEESWRILFDRAGGAC
jgi:hypothetical protein